eukprot:Cvel_2794.t1-p1 / transcript=Cvel_2794.t1 / gene=Cvel_2794 / organism=Chromera_velia_CCMP2878 / gene_product=Probable cysteine desulfurase, mitochondrial, putative / transcript_product=Probable cysteine desulfurase, mitochondrial, putative / location=Cvel_scaffold113:5218-6321(-) / protein_length=368 / sequence_SO=supercontig / SO=protein_coding / is_pseudo=false
MLPFYRERHGNPHSSGHAVGWASSKAVDAATTSISKLIGCDPDEVIFTSGATESNNIAIIGSAHGAHGNRSKIFTTAIEHKSTLNICRHLATEGYEIIYAPVDGSGRIDIEGLSEIASEDAFMFTFGLVNSEIGTIQAHRAISEIAKSSGALMHWDAAQAPAAIDVNDLAEHSDFVSLSGHKMYGPQGIGALFVRRSHQPHVQPLLYGGGQQLGLRPGTLPAALCVGMGHAAELVSTSAHTRQARDELRVLRDRFVSGVLDAHPQVRINGPSLGERHPGNANLIFPGYDAEDILALLQPGLAASTGSACTSGIPEPSHVLRGIGLTHDEAVASLRFCLGRFSTSEEVETAIQMISEALDCLDPVRIAS